MGNLQREKGGRWTMRVGIGGKRYCRSTRTFGCQSNDYSVEAEATPESVFAKVASDDSVKNTNLALSAMP